MEDHDLHSIPTLDELCIRAIDKNVEFVPHSSSQMQILSQLPDEVKAKIFEYFAGTSMRKRNRWPVFCNSNLLSAVAACVF
jgi:hypothetical protein